MHKMSNDGISHSAAFCFLRGARRGRNSLQQRRRVTKRDRRFERGKDRMSMVSNALGDVQCSLLFLLRDIRDGLGIEEIPARPRSIHNQKSMRLCRTRWMR